MTKIIFLFRDIWRTSSPSTCSNLKSCAATRAEIHFLKIKKVCSDLFAKTVSRLGKIKSLFFNLCFYRFPFPPLVEILFGGSDLSLSKVLLFADARDIIFFKHFDFQMCFALQTRALFEHLNFQKCYGNEVFLVVWLPNLLRATTACNFSSLISPDGFALAPLASLLFDPPGRQTVGKHRVSGLFCLFACLLLSSGSSRLCFSICPYCRKFHF